MPDQANIFGSNQQATPANQTPADGNGGNAQNTDHLATLLGSIKNERGEPKYKTLEDALKALQHSQEYIPTLKQTKEELEQKLNELSARASKVDELERTVQELTQRSQQAPNQGPAGLNEEQVAELVTRTLTRQQQEAIQRTNTETVAQTVRSKFGDKAEEVFYGRAKELGMTNAEINALAARTPKAVLKLLGIEDGVQAPARSTTGFNTEGFTPAQDSAIGPNKKRIMLGATTQDLREESESSRKMVEELAEQGLSISDLTKPSVYNKIFLQGKK